MEMTEAGLGYRRFSDEIQQRKWNNFLTGLSQDSTTRASFEGLMMRATRFGGLRLLPQQGGVLEKVMTPCWARSLLENLDECGLTLCRGGDMLTGTHNQPLRTTGLSEEQLLGLTKHGMYNLGDLTTVTPTGECVWHDLGIKELTRSNLLEQTALPTGVFTITTDSAWVVEDDIPYVAEYLGLRGMLGHEDINIRIWQQR